MGNFNKEELKIQIESDNAQSDENKPKSRRTKKITISIGVVFVTGLVTLFIHFSGHTTTPPLAEAQVTQSPSPTQPPNININNINVTTSADNASNATTTNDTAVEASTNQATSFAGSTPTPTPINNTGAAITSQSSDSSGTVTNDTPTPTPITAPTIDRVQINGTPIDRAATQENAAIIQAIVGTTATVSLDNGQDQPDKEHQEHIDIHPVGSNEITVSVPQSLEDKVFKHHDENGQDLSDFVVGDDTLKSNYWLEIWP